MLNHSVAFFHSKKISILWINNQIKLPLPQSYRPNDMSITRAVKQPFIWLARLRHRCGYGVHSPFAFELITNVFYEKTPYYAYEELKQKESSGKKLGKTSRKVKRLLFRLVNRFQPQRIVDVGLPSSAISYLQAAKKDTFYTIITYNSHWVQPIEDFFDFIYIHHPDDPYFVEKTFNQYVKYAHEKTVCIIEGIYQSGDMKKLWRKLCQEEVVGITFDLYDLGIIFFDRKKVKQHYIVNF